MDKLKLFIGSSVEGLDIAHAIQENLTFDAEVTLWTQGVFQLSTSIISNLLNQLSKFDFAIFVFSPDDIVKLRDTEVKTTRDNVIFETGLFIGKLSLERVFFIKPRGQNMHLPTDLLGIIAGEYEIRSDDNLTAATGVFCNQVKQAIKRLGKFDQQILKDKNSNNDYDNSLTILFTYLKDKGWTTMSFKKIEANVHPKLTEEYLMKLIDLYPKAIRRCRIREGLYGIKWLSNE